MHRARLGSHDKPILIGNDSFDRRVAIVSKPKYYAQDVLDAELQNRILSTLKFDRVCGQLNIYPSGRITIQQGPILRQRKLKEVFSLLEDISNTVVSLNDQYALPKSSNDQMDKIYGREQDFN